jgi:integrase
MAYVERRGAKRWRARYRTPSGVERSKTFERRSDAERFLVGISGDIIRGDWTDPRLGRTTFDEWVEEWKTTVELRPTTRALYLGVLRKYLEPRFAGWPLSRIQVSDVKAMVKEERDAARLSNSAIRCHVRVLSSIMQSAVDAEPPRLGRNPCVGVKLPPDRSRKMRFLEIDKVLRLAEAHPQHYRPLVLTAALVGLRWGELAGLRLERVDLLRKQIRVEEQLVEIGGVLEWGPPKTESGARTVTIPGVLIPILAEHFASSAVQRSGLAFPTPTGLPMRRSNFRRVFAQACGSVGERLTFHELRHTAAALAIAAGAHPLAIKERLGHSSIVVTMDRYGGRFPRLDVAIAEGIDGAYREALAASVRPAAASEPRSRRSTA